MPLSEREQIARIIDPLAFQLTDALNNAEGEPPELRRKATEMRDVKLAAAHAKADAILALRSKAEASLGGEGFSSSSADSATRRPSVGCDTEAQSPAGGGE